VCKQYRLAETVVSALVDVSLSVYPGEVVAVMGPSGCGKTTLLNCLTGLDEVTSGSVRIGGRELTDLSDRERTALRAREIGFVFQTANLLPVLNGVENVELPLLVSGVRPREARARALEAIEAVGMRERARHRPAQLSGGQAQRFAIARALATRPAIVWADEATGQLDSRASNDLLELMLRLNAEQGLTLVLITHAREVAAKAKRLIEMRDGAIVGDRPLVG